MPFWRFIAPNADLGQELFAAHSPFLVALSFFVAMLGGYAKPLILHTLRAVLETMPESDG